MASSKRNRQRVNRGPVVIPEPPPRGPTGGNWVRLADMDPAWIFKKCHPLWQEARPVAPTKEKRKESAELPRSAYAHLPPHLRPASEVRPDLRKEGRDFLLVHRIDDDTTDLIMFKRRVEMVWHVRLSERTARGISTIYKDGEPWAPLLPAYVVGYPDTEPDT